MRPSCHRAFLASVVVVALLILPGCLGGKMARGHDIDTGGDAHRGERAIGQYSCGSCHWIPGIRNARGMVGPPLMMFGRRTFIGGEVANTPDNLVQWIRNPQSIEAKTAMPNLGVSDQDARDIAAYLYTLR
jgi:cytochrome c